MVLKLVLKSKVRGEKDTNPAKLRREGFVPAVLYGPKTKNINLKISRLELEQLYFKSGESSLVDLEIDGEKKLKVIIKDVQKNIINDQLEHVDFYVVDMKKTIEVEVPLEFIGEAPAVKELGGTFMKNLESIQVRCLPGDLVENIQVELSSLKTYEDDIKVSDLIIPENFEVLTQLTAQVANVLAPRIVEDTEKTEEETKETDDGDKDDKKIEERDKKEEEKKDDKDSKDKK